MSVIQAHFKHFIFGFISCRHKLTLRHQNRIYL